jgi:hypothetical protein
MRGCVQLSIDFSHGSFHESREYDMRSHRLGGSDGLGDGANEAIAVIMAVERSDARRKKRPNEANFGGDVFEMARTRWSNEANAAKLAALSAGIDGSERANEAIPVIMAVGRRSTSARRPERSQFWQPEGRRDPARNRANGAKRQNGRIANAAPPPKVIERSQFWQSNRKGRRDPLETDGPHGRCDVRSASPRVAPRWGPLIH